MSQAVLDTSDNRQETFKTTIVQAPSTSALLRYRGWMVTEIIGTNKAALMYHISKENHYITTLYLSRNM